MEEKRELPNRKHPRLDNYDYSSAGAYFITICTQNRRCALSRIVGRGLAPAEEYTSNEYQIKYTKYQIRQSVLTKEDEEAIANGASVDVYIEVNNIKESVEKETVNKVKELVGRRTDMTYLDLSLYKKVGDNDATTVHELNSLITITIIVPEELRGEGNEFSIIRFHDGDAEVINGKYNQKTHEFTFSTDRFSTYVLTAKKPAPGVDTYMGLMGLTFIVFCSSIAIVGSIKKARKIKRYISGR